MKVRDLMTKDVSSCSQESSLAAAAQLMWEQDCGCLPVTDGSSRLVGVITDRDICMAAYTRGKPLDQMVAESAMSRETVSCSPDDSLRTVEELMRERQVRRIPVVTEGKLVGMVGLGDLVRHAATGVQGTLTVPGLMKTLEGIYERREAAAAAE